MFFKLKEIIDDVILDGPSHWDITKTIFSPQEDVYSPSSKSSDYVTVYNVESLKDALSQKKRIIVTDRELAGKISKLYGRSNYYGSCGAIQSTAAGIATLTGLSIPVALALIAGIGIVAIVIMLMNYRFERRSDGTIILEPA